MIRVPWSGPTVQLLFRPLLLVYQMPKVGSQSIEATLNESKFPDPILRFHYLSEAFGDTLRHGLASDRPGVLWKQNAIQQLDFIQKTGSILRWRKRLALCGLRIPKVNVVTGVRDLLSLVLASVFENYSYFANDFQSMTVERCREALLHPKTFKTLKDWFDLELKGFTGIDVFQRQFPTNMNYTIHENRFARVLVYRFECLPSLPALLSRFLRWPIARLVTCNSSGSKEYFDQYNFVRRELRLPKDFVKSICDFKMMRHFFSLAERKQICARWAEADAEVMAPLVPEAKRQLCTA
ncbi:MAG TPA: putative capsular polysaccharide synthesis family protein [Verrucomicrobiae bacterium]|nr:putative capsular polysaccharide synthesis family protein [Verrucomicrobiae bacterium]